MGRVFINGTDVGVTISGRAIPKLKKWCLITSSLTLSIISYVSRVKCNNPRKIVSPFPTTRSSRYRKGSPQLDLD